MEIKGTIKTVLPPAGGTTKKGTQWAAQQYILQTEGDTPVSILLEAFGQENIDRLALVEGESVTVRYDPEVNEFKDHYFGKNRIREVFREDTSFA